MGLTIHVPERPIDPAEASALELIRELAAARPDIEAVDTTAGDLPRLEVSMSPDGDCSAAVVRAQGRQRLGHSKRQEWDQEIARLDHGSPADAVLADLLVVTAHRVLRADLLITTSAVLLELRDDRFYKGKNICSPMEGCKVLGLYLRSQRVYEVSARGVVLDVGRYGFYEILTDELLLRLHVYTRACSKVSRLGALSALGLDRLAETLWKRAKWSLEARDAIAIRFHQPANWMILDEMLYHFNYLTLLLVGMFDVQARVARRVYELRAKDRDVGLWKQAFVNLLEAGGATALAALARRDEFVNFGTLLKKLRNTIHGAAPQARVEQTHGPALSGFLTVDPADSVAIWNAADRMGGAESWGLSRPWKPDEVMLEPYAYCLRLLTVAFQFAQDIADATDVSRLTPGESDPTIRKQRNDPFEAEERRRVLLLG